LKHLHLVKVIKFQLRKRKKKKKVSGERGRRRRKQKIKRTKKFVLGDFVKLFEGGWLRETDL